MSYKLSELKKMSDEKLIEEHDKHAIHTMVGINYYLDEIRHRDQSRIADRMENLTNRIWWLTLAVTVATFVNLAVAIFK